MSVQLPISPQKQEARMLPTPVPPTSSRTSEVGQCYFRVQLIGHEEGEDPNTHSKVVLYRTVVQYNGQAFERALRFSRFYAFYSNLTSVEKKAVRASFPRRYPFVAVLDEDRLKLREKQLNAFFAALCQLAITPTMELSLLNLFKIKERHLGPHIRGSILFVPNPRVDGTSSEVSMPPPIRRVFMNDGDSMQSSRSSFHSQCSIMSAETNASRPLNHRLSSSSAASPLPSTRSRDPSTNTSDISNLPILGN
ncbi:hypothetical protein DYB37_010472 [Aphanomyces astaci]|uniref:PX domain-containing protein n=1 Tax=Aphanomyces astaci TaxID=112090 RepID=A0A3R6XU25_APHAT|nr:hypothetical protein DYB37_010472 [Aphanomyces astaci]